MSNNLQFEENKLYKILCYLHWFFLSSIYFTLLNILLIISLLIFDFQTITLPIFFITSITIGPTLVTLCSFMNKIIYENYVDTTRDFFIAFKDNFFDSLKLWLVISTILFILILDLNICFAVGHYLFFLLLIMFIFTTIVTSYSIAIVAKYKLKLLDTLKLSFYFTLKFPKTTILNLIIICGTISILLFSKNIISLFIVSISCFLLMKNMKYCFLFIENKYLK